jgi:hypothetical protein
MGSFKPLPFIGVQSNRGPIGCINLVSLYSAYNPSLSVLPKLYKLTAMQLATSNKQLPIKVCNNYQKICQLQQTMGVTLTHCWQSRPGPILRHIVLDARCVQIGLGGKKIFYLGGNQRLSFVFKRPAIEGGL